VNNILIGRIAYKPKEKNKGYASSHIERAWKIINVYDPKTAEHKKRVNDVYRDIVFAASFKVAIICFYLGYISHFRCIVSFFQIRIRYGIPLIEEDESCCCC